MTEKKDPVEEALDKLKPFLSKFGFGGAMGFCSGLAMKKVGRSFAVTIGFIFVGLQVASSAGYIDMKWDKVKDDAVAAIDTTGDGNVDMDDVKAYWIKLKTLLTNKLPDAGGFSLGFLYGVKNG